MLDAVGNLFHPQAAGVQRLALAIEGGVGAGGAGVRAGQGGGQVGPRDQPLGQLPVLPGLADTGYEFRILQGRDGGIGDHAGLHLLGIIGRADPQALIDRGGPRELVVDGAGVAHERLEGAGLGLDLPIGADRLGGAPLRRRRGRAAGQ